MSEELKIVTLADYEVVFDNSLKYLQQFLQKKSYSSILILADDQTTRYCYPKLIERLPELAKATLITVPAGEQNKHLSTCEEIWAGMLRSNADRRAVLLNLGGGVIGDMGGFAAACYKRGVDFIQVPTTILSQVDSSIGGKLGVDFKYGKNLIGVFKNPALVIISDIWLDTLSERQLYNGFAEVLKHALIQDKYQWQYLSSLDTFPPQHLQAVLYQSLLIKKEVVTADPYEKGLRKILNFGHTIGHAIEAWSLESDEQPLLHGEAIAIGMIMEAYIGHLKSGLERMVLDEITATLRQFYAPYQLSAQTAANVWPIMTLDKKNAGSKILTVTLKAIGEPVIDVEITPELLEKSIQYYQSLG